jgi:uncharacterized protein (DUF1800 family)
MLPLIAGAAGLGLLGYGLKKAGVVSFGAEDSTHDKIYKHLLEWEKDPSKLALMGHAFASAGKTDQSKVLLKRAAIPGMSKATKAARKAVTAKAFKSHDPVVVEKVAAAFEAEGCVGHARNLREYATALRQIIATAASK